MSTLEQRRAFWMTCSNFSLEGFVYFCRTCLQIRVVADDGTWRYIPFVLNDEQRHLISLVIDKMRAGKPVRIIILKARKLGMSTVILALGYWLSSFRPGWKNLIVAHKSAATAEIASIAIDFAARLPKPVKPRIGASVANKGLVWKNGSTLRVETQRSDDAARGSSPSLIHMSELASWKTGRARTTEERTITALLGALDLVGGTLAFIESTAEGATGSFYERFTSAYKNPHGVWTPLFFPWHESAKHQPAMTAEEQAAYIAHKTAKEAGNTAAALAAYAPFGFPELWLNRSLEFDLTPPQIQWALDKTAEYNGDKDKFDQEHPLSPEMAFLSSGRPVFDAQQIADWTRTAPEPLYTSGLLSLQKGQTQLTQALTPGGEWQFWAMPELGWKNRYIASADISAGTGDGDYACIQVYDRDTRQQVAEFYSRKTPPEIVAEQLKLINVLYGATLAPEINNHGAVTVRALLDAKLTDCLYRRRAEHVPGKDGWLKQWGFQTDVKTRGLLVTALAGALRQGLFVPKSKSLLHELANFQYSASGKAEARVGKHDDAVIAIAIALHLDASLPRSIRSIERIPSTKQPAYRPPGDVWGKRR